MLILQQASGSGPVSVVRYTLHTTLARLYICKECICMLYTRSKVKRIGGKRENVFHFYYFKVLLNIILYINI